MLAAPTRQQALDQAPLLCLPLRHPAQFYTGFTPVPLYGQPDGGEEGCWSPRRPTQGFTPVGNWLYPGGESARCQPALIPPLGAANLCAQGGGSSSRAPCIRRGTAGAGTWCLPAGNCGHFPRAQVRWSGCSPLRPALASLQGHRLPPMALPGHPSLAGAGCV